MSSRRYGKYNPHLVYTEPYIQTTLEEAIRENQERIREWELRQQLFRCAYKTRTTKAGRMLEVEIYPSFLDRKDYTRALHRQRTNATQKKQNDKNAARKLIRIFHANFVEGDIVFTGGFAPERQPASLEGCKRVVRNYLNTLKYHSKKAGAGPIRYIYVIEQARGKDGRARYHVHMVMSRNAGANCEGVDARDWIESKWSGGDYDNSRRLQWKRGGGFTGISKYFTKQFEELHTTERPGLRHWGQSLGLKSCDGTPTESYSRFRKRRVARLLQAAATMKAEFEREYPGYSYLEEYPCEVRYSEVVDGYYLYCRMYRRE